MRQLAPGRAHSRVRPVRNVRHVRNRQCEVEPGTGSKFAFGPDSSPMSLDNVLLVAAWDDASCSPENSLPLASKNEEEIVSGQTRTIALNMANHQGPCPPQGVAPIPEAQYTRILALWPSYNFKPYAERTENTECTGDTTDADAGN